MHQGWGDGSSENFSLHLVCTFTRPIQSDNPKEEADSFNSECDEEKWKDNGSQSQLRCGYIVIEMGTTDHSKDVQWSGCISCPLKSARIRLSSLPWNNRSGFDLFPPHGGRYSTYATYGLGQRESTVEFRVEANTHHWLPRRGTEPWSETGPTKRNKEEVARTTASRTETPSDGSGIDRCTQVSSNRTGLKCHHG